MPQEKQRAQKWIDHTALATKEDFFINSSWIFLCFHRRNPKKWADQTPPWYATTKVDGVFNLSSGPLLYIRPNLSQYHKGLGTRLSLLQFASAMQPHEGVLAEFCKDSSRIILSSKNNARSFHLKFIGFPEFSYQNVPKLACIPMTTTRKLPMNYRHPLGGLMLFNKYHLHSYEFVC